MKKRPFLILILSFIFVSLACRSPFAATPTPIPSPIPTITLAPLEAAPTAVPVDTATAILPTEIPVEAETAVPAVEEIEATEAPETATPEVEVLPTVVEGEVFGPGQQDSRVLPGGGGETYLIDGVKFTPRFVFAETPGEIDLLLSVEDTEANFSGPGDAEVLVFTADENGRYDLMVRNLSHAEGEYTIYLYDAAQAVPGAVHQSNVALTEGQTVQYQVESRGGRPVLIFVDPLDQSDVAVQVTADDGQVAADANYSGPGSAEAAFVLPLETTRYTVTVREINNQASQLNVLLVPLE